MARKPRSVAEEIAEERERAARSPRKKKTSTLSEPLRELAEKTGMVTGDRVLKQLEPATMESILASRKAKERIEDEFPVPEPLPSAEAAPTWQERVTSPDRPPIRFAPVPAGFMNVDVYPLAGLKVNKSLDRNVVAIQFADDQTPSQNEKLFMQGKGLSYQPGQKQWTRYDPERPGANILDGKAVASIIAEDRHRMAEVMGPAR